MVNKGEFIEFAAKIEWDDKDIFNLPSTTLQIISELAKKITELENRIKEIEK